MPDDLPLADTVTAVAPAGARVLAPTHARGGRVRRDKPPVGHVGRYALRARIGEGGLGVVWSAHDPLLARPIAVKTIALAAEESERPGFHDAFLNEARAIGALAHPHIVTVHDAGIDGDRAWIAMELLKGRDLRQLRREGWRATPQQAALICRRVADALAFAHAKGVVHRDIKPANIFMVGRTQPRVLDFGIARVARPSGPAPGAADDPMRGAGSPHFMSPEQHRGEAGDRRVDVYALGAVLYELLTDRKPYVGDTLAAIRSGVLRGEAPPADRVEPAVPADLAAIVARAMAVDPEARHRSAQSLSRDLRRWLDAHPDEDDSAPGALSAAEPVGDAGADAAPAAAVARPAVATPRAAAVEARTASPDPAPPSPAPRRAPVRLVVGTLVAMALAAALGTGIARWQQPPATVSAAKVPSPPPGTAAVATAPRGDAAVAPFVPAGPVVPGSAGTAIAPTPPAPVATTGTLQLAVAPWGEIEVDGVRRGATPPLVTLELREGRHTVVVRNGDFPPATHAIDVVAGRSTVLRHRFGS